KPVRIFGWLAAWVWTIVAGFGGLGLLITQGPLPVTNGSFALLSGISACPLTAWLVKRKAGITLSGWTRFAIAFLIIVLGRLVLKMEGRGTFLTCHDAGKKAAFDLGRATEYTGYFFKSLVNWKARPLLHPRYSREPSR